MDYVYYKNRSTMFRANFNSYLSKATFTSIELTIKRNSSNSLISLLSHKPQLFSMLKTLALGPYNRKKLLGHELHELTQMRY